MKESLMTEARTVKVSKWIAKHLRHSPEAIGLVLEPGGWVQIDDLLAACERNLFPVTRSELDFVVQNNNKQRFGYDETQTKIRARQGHSVQVDLELAPQSPPDILFHGTGAQYVTPILEEGLRKMNRQHVHLSHDTETAHNVGRRHGRPVVLIVLAGAMCKAGHVFYQSDNGVWLTDFVPPQFVRRSDE